MTNPRNNDNSGELFDYIKRKFKLKRDVELAALLETPKSKISEIRNGRLPVGDTLLVRICDKAGVSLRYAKAMLDKRAT